MACFICPECGFRDCYENECPAHGHPDNPRNSDD